MQELHSTAAAAGGRFFGGGVGDRRLRPHNNHQQNQQQALKCPRCDSPNTKFCYYNNYNLSQPRHFCKNCRRYWTKGGVLRNVPIGGGCRKPKRSNNKSKNSNNHRSSSSETAPETTPTPQPQLPEGKSNSHSSSESSSLTAVAATEAVSPTTSNAALSNKVFLHENANNPNFNGGGGGGGDCGVFSDIGTFTSLMSSADEALAFGFGNSGSFLDTTSFRFGSAHSGNDQLPAVPGGGGECEWQQQQVMGIGSDGHRNHQGFAYGPSMLDQTVPVELSSLRSGKTGHGGSGPFDWHAAGGGADQGLFDLSNAVDQGYWTHTHWSNHDNPTLFHLP